MFKKYHAAKLKAAEDLQDATDLRALVAGLTAADGTIRQDGLDTYLAFIKERSIDPGTIAPDAMNAVKLGLARGGVLVQVDVSLLLKRDEFAIEEAAAALLKEVVDREFRGGSRGVSVPLGHGIRYRTGSMRGQMVAIGTHWTVADTGSLTVTNQRVVYHGGRKTLEFPYAKLVTVNVYTDAIDLGVTNRQTTSSFRVTDPDHMSGMIHAAFEARDGHVETIVK